MKKICMIAGMIFLIGFLAKPSAAIAQAGEEDLAAFLEASEADASKLITAYLQPVVRSLSYSMTGGWYTTAKAHSTLGFDLSISVNAAFIPTAENFFDPNKLGLSASTVYNGARDNGSTGPFNPSRKAPTIFGPKDETRYTSTYDPDGAGPIPIQTNTFNGPEGFDVKNEIGVAAIPTPMVQLGIGVIKNTDVKFRFIPEQEVGSSKIKMFGIGVLHDIKQHIAGIKLLPFDLSALIAYNSVTGSTDLSSDGSGGVPASPNGVGDYKFNSWVFQALISKKISVLTGYAGVGYNMVNTNVDVKGDYTIVSDGAYSYVITDPVAIDFKNKSMRFTLGMRLKLGPIFFNGDYTFQKYNTLSVGFGVAVR
ncbi:MAG TPA: DUF6588 family protein [Cyclobacteriaceae bacterium]|nr:DUF6588 family protein [Cyclobacteriaceae bacterium]